MRSTFIPEVSAEGGWLRWALVTLCKNEHKHNYSQKLFQVFQKDFSKVVAQSRAQERVSIVKIYSFSLFFI